ncbi:MAG: alkaline phosphatase family protein, partial [Acidobacteria bacterium]|nr:alkaline phosphatase family protein [Acidobacteriota bacterium]
MLHKVLLVVIDAATPHVVCPAIHTGRLPNLRRLAEAGGMHEASASIFPSITPAATTSIITGAYPSEHGIAGASWYDEARDEVAYYGDDFWTIAREGFGAFVRDFLLRLNGDRLRAPTLFEMVERAGRSAACLNYLVFRGLFAHRVNMPKLIATLPGVPFTETVEGPSTLSLGDFVGTRSAHGRRLDDKGGLLHRFGMDDASTGAMLRDLAEGSGLPDFTVAYFADNDFRSHEVGPVAALPVVERVDAMLGEAFDAAGGLDRLLLDTVVIVTSDHGHCEVLGADRGGLVQLDECLGNYTQADLARPWKAGDEVMICPNMRAAQIYLQRPSADLVARISDDLLGHPGVDQVMWQTKLTRPGAAGYTVASFRGRMEFARGDGPGGSSTDVFGGTWHWSGEGAVLGIEMEGRLLRFAAYPNAFERLAGVLDLDKSGEIWVTARPGCEFEVAGGKAHTGGASHGALHALDSLSPVIVAGGGIRLPREMRSVDIGPLCMEALGVPMRYRPG